MLLKVPVTGKYFVDEYSVSVKDDVDEFWTSLILRGVWCIFWIIFAFIKTLPVSLKIPVTGKCFVHGNRNMIDYPCAYFFFQILQTLFSKWDIYMHMPCFSCMKGSPCTIYIFVLLLRHLVAGFRLYCFL